MINWIKRKLGVTAIEEAYNQKVQELDRHLKWLQENARMDADVGFSHRGNNTIILTGIYRGRAYVQFYDMGNGEFERLVEQMRDMKKYALIRHVDAPPMFKAAFDL